MIEVSACVNAEKIRDNTLETLLELVEVPLPEAIVQAQVNAALHEALHPIDHDEERLEPLESDPGETQLVRAEPLPPRAIGTTCCLEGEVVMQATDGREDVSYSELARRLHRQARGFKLDVPR